jgi:uncharacterized protein (TIGR02246 family)
MNRRLLIGSSGVLLAIAAGCTQSVSASFDADVRAVKDNEVQWNKDFEAKDVDKLVAHYTSDATLMAPGVPPSNGAEAIRGMLKQMVGDNSLSLKFQETRVDVAKSGDFAYSQGSYTMTMTDPATKKPVNDAGSYVTIYKKVDGAWKAVSDIASSSTPMPAPAQNPPAAAH